MTKADRLVAALAAIGTLAGFAAIALRAADDKPAADGKQRIFEMRTYIANEGKLDALHARFRDHTNRLFIKHQIEPIGYWTPADPARQNTLLYILAYPSREAREASWKAFREDPEWKKAAADSERNGKLVKQVVSEIMTPTDYSPMK